MKKVKLDNIMTNKICFFEMWNHSSVPLNILKVKKAELKGSNYTKSGSLAGQDNYV